MTAILETHVTVARAELFFSRYVEPFQSSSRHSRFSVGM